MVFVIIGAVLLGGIILAGGGNTLTGLGKDIQTTTDRVSNHSAE